MKHLFILLFLFILPAFAKSEEPAGPYLVEVAFIKTIHIKFPSRVLYVDLGSNYLMAGKAEETENILRVKATYKGFEEETNFSVICEDGSFFSFVATYNDNPEILYHEMNRSSNALLAGADIRLSDIQGESPVLFHMIIHSIYKRNERAISHLGDKRSGIESTLRGIYIHNDLLYFNLNMRNLSNISYDIDYIRYTIRDKKKIKKQAQQEYTLSPVREYNGNRMQRIPGKRSYHTIVAFGKFTFPPDKIMVVEIFEKGGGRNLRFVVRHSDIIAAGPIKSLFL